MEDDQVRPASGEAPQRRRTVVRPLDVVPRPDQVADDDLGDRRIVVDDQNVAAFGARQECVPGPESSGMFSISPPRHAGAARAGLVRCFQADVHFS